MDLAKSQVPGTFNDSYANYTTLLSSDLTKALPLKIVNSIA